MKPERYELICTHTRKVVGAYKSRSRATNAADKRDLAYGAICCTVRAVWGEAA